MPQKQIAFQLIDGSTGKAITDTGGMAAVHANGAPARQAVVDSAGASATNPVALSSGHFETWVDDAVAAVDIFGIGPNGHAFSLKGVVPGTIQEIYLDSQRNDQVLIVPFSHDDSVAATEFDTGMDLPAKALVRGIEGGSILEVIDVDATETIGIGLLSSESGGDVDGLVALGDVAVAGLAGALDGVLIVADVGHFTDAVTAKSITYTTTAGSDTVAGYYHMAYKLAQAV